MKTVDEVLETASEAIRIEMAKIAIGLPTEVRRRRAQSRRSRAAVAVLGGSVLIVGSVWLFAGRTPAPEFVASSVAVVTTDPLVTTTAPEDAEPRLHEGTNPDTTAALAFTEFVTTLPGFPDQLVATSSVEILEGKLRTLDVYYTAPDKAIIEVMMERMERPVRIQDIVPPDGASQSFGPNGELIMWMGAGGAIQVIAIDEDLLMVNLSVEQHTDRKNLDAPSSLDWITHDTLTAWALSLLGSMADDL